MPITTSAKKALRNSARKQMFNARKKDGMQTVLKKFRKFVTEKNKGEAQKMLATIQKTLDKAAKTGLIKKNTASRKKSRLAAMVKKMA
jgi:small subunit ribosomal protein S20